jgi:hypothetical protein
MSAGTVVMCPTAARIIKQCRLRRFHPPVHSSTVNDGLVVGEPA